MLFLRALARGMFFALYAFIFSPSVKTCGFATSLVRGRLSVSKNPVFDTLGGCLKGCRGKECASVGVYRYGKRRTTQKAKALAPPGPTVFWINKKNESVTCSFFSEFMLLLRPAAFFDSLRSAGRRKQAVSSKFRRRRCLRFVHSYKPKKSRRILLTRRTGCAKIKTTTEWIANIGLDFRKASFARPKCFYRDADLKS